MAETAVWLRPLYSQDISAVAIHKPNQGWKTIRPRPLINTEVSWLLFWLL